MLRGGKAQVRAELVSVPMENGLQPETLEELIFVEGEQALN